ncbi:MAG: hypothetical protein FJX76_15545 [Armatimonadetes bacterium]|nr:hypothetical protein [Armatimonadota bacterium]
MDGVGAIGSGGGGLDEFKKAQEARVADVRQQGETAKGGGSSASDAAQSVASAQGGDASQYPQV